MAALATRIARAGPGAIKQAKAVLAAGGLVAFPTETVYGLGADAANDSAVAKLYAAKERPAFNPLIAHVVDLAAARRLAQFSDEALKLAGAFWPGPMTLVLRKAATCTVGQLATAGLDTVAVRVPSHPVARELLLAFGKPVVAPSANRSGRISPTSAQHVMADLAGRIDLIVDADRCPVGVESTILSCVGRAALLRPGAVPRVAVERFLGRDIGIVAVLDDDAGGDAAPIAPGMLASHYAPRASLRMNALDVAPGEALLAFGPDALPGVDAATAVMNLSVRGDLDEAAANLFGYLRALDAKGARTIAVMPVPHHGLGEAINDRLRRAAVERK